MVPKLISCPPTAHYSIMTGNPVHFIRATTGFTDISDRVIPGQLLFFNAAWEAVVAPCDFLADVVAKGCGSDHAMRSYGAALKHFFRACEVSGIPWDEVTTSDLFAYRRSLLTECAGSTVNHRFAAIKGFYNTCVSRGTIAGSPFPPSTGEERNPFKVREDEIRPRAIPPEDLRAIFENLTPTFRLISVLALTSGLRAVEFEEFKLSHLPVVPDRYSPFTYFKLRRKGGAKKTVAIPTALVDELHRYIDFGERASIREKFYDRGDPIRSRAAAFLTSRGNPIKANYISKAFCRAARSASLHGKGYSFHGLRHTYALTMAKELTRANGQNRAPCGI
jgi:integrase